MSMSSESKGQSGKSLAATEAADQLMKQRRFAEAIALYDQHLAAVPNDLVALLKLGICHLLNRSEQRFLAIHAQTKEMMASMSEVPAEAQALWRKYEGLAVKVTAGTMVVGGLALTGCSNSETKPAKPAVTAPVSGGPVQPPASSHRYSGGVYLPLENLNPAPQNPPSSAHKYSGGVYLNPKAIGNGGNN